MISMPSAVVNPTSSAGKEKILFKAVEAARAAFPGMTIGMGLEPCEKCVK